MKNQRTRHALLMSMMSILLCIAMLIGSTFAWFTDTASTSVNKIEAGTLEVDIVDATDATTSLKNDTLKFVKAEGAAQNEAVLWEPGATYNLTPFKIKNNGSLALKYKVTVSGGTGDTELLDVIDFKVQKGNETATELANWEGKLAANASSDTVTISGTMKTTAGNTYQGKTLDGISITVTATQDTVEYDSTTNTYDKLAEYPIVETLTAAVNVGTDKKTTASATLTSDTKAAADSSTPVVTATIPEGVKLADGVTSVSLTVKETETSADVTVQSDESARTLDVDVTGLATGTGTANDKPVVVSIFVGKGLNNLKLYHNEDPMTAVNSAENLADGHYYYNKDSGILTFASSTFSPFTFVYNLDGEKVSTADELAAAVKNGGKVILENDLTLTESLNITKNVTLDLNGKTLNSASDSHTIYVTDGTLTLTGNGTINCTAANKAAVFASGSGANVIIANGTFDGGRGGNNVCVWAHNGANVTIKGGTFTVGADASGSGNSVVYSEGGNIAIEGGFFSTPYSYNNKYYVLNKNNSTSETITVKGGTFVNYNPAGGDDTGNPGNFVANGYKAVSATQTSGDVWYTVVAG